jgi:hypothetical protein
MRVPHYFLLTDYPVKMRTVFAAAPFRWTDPTTWPWIIYLWLALLVGGWLLSSWRWLKRKRAAGWPIAEGRIESTEVTKPNFSFTAKHGYYLAQMGYSYSVAGSIHSGLYKREFPTQPAADDFVLYLKAKAVAVRYSPNKPSLSMLLEPDIEAVLQNRPPFSGDESVTRTAIPEWLRPFIWVFVWLSAIGLLVSLWVHIGAVKPTRESQQGWAMSCALLGCRFGALSSGILSDRLGRKLS